MFRKILIANRGEIACRVIATCRRLGVRSVAVYSDADADARHVRLADESIHIGPPPARESYLRADAILDAAKGVGAEAVHPGYGFLSENAEFAEACEAAGIAFIGPPASAIRAMGSKSAAKTLMEAAGVALVPGHHGDDDSLEVLARKAGVIGYPVLLKASAGGGGKGMRIVANADEFEKQLDSCKREAKASFGDDRMLVEKYLERPRHIEIQVFADTHGNFVHLFERDCSVQRRHQKVIEEAPAPGMSPERRDAMGQAAIAAAQAVGYVGAGTVEFIVDRDGHFYFMEMNTRLQVEHPVTEMITGLDLVEWQLRVASGERLPRTQDELAIDGHAVEARIYAEDPTRKFLPSVGLLVHVHMPGGDGVRVDTGVETGDAITPFYDPMIAKLVAKGADRESALRKLGAALRNTRIVGVRNNVEFLARITENASFVRGDFDTGLIEREGADLLPDASDLPIEAQIAVALFRHAREDRSRATDELDPHSPWAEGSGWRLNAPSVRTFEFEYAKQERALTLTIDGGTLCFEHADGSCLVSESSCDGDAVRFTCDGRQTLAHVIAHRAAHVVFLDGRSFTIESIDRLSLGSSAAAAHQGFASPMPGRVVTLLVEVGKRVAAGAPLLVLEAMKMEHTITAPARGVVKRFLFGEGDQVPEGAALLEFEAES